MSFTNFQMAWAVPVRVEVLGAHLEAYANLLPTLNELGLCNRYGQGEHAAVARLSIELIVRVEDCLVAEEREKMLAAWKEDFKCFKNICQNVDHLTRDQLAEIWARAIQGQLPGQHGHGRPVDGPEMIDFIQRYIGNFRHEYIWPDTHEERKLRWERRAGFESKDLDAEESLDIPEQRRDYFTLNNQFVRKQFGLEIWTSHVAVESIMVKHVMQGGRPKQTTIAYLKIRGDDLGLTERAELSDILVRSDSTTVQSGYGIPMRMPKPLSNSERVCFKRMMSVLDLSPFYDEKLEGLGWNLDTDPEHPYDIPGEVHSWPQLTVLVRRTASI